MAAVIQDGSPIRMTPAWPCPKATSGQLRMGGQGGKAAAAAWWGKLRGATCFAADARMVADMAGVCCMT